MKCHFIVDLDFYGHDLLCIGGTYLSQVYQSVIRITLLLAKSGILTLVKYTNSHYGWTFFLHIEDPGIVFLTYDICQ